MWVWTTGFKMFSSSELKAATKGFSDKNIIARGEAAIIWKVIHTLVFGTSPYSHEVINIESISSTAWHGNAMKSFSIT